MSSTEPISKEMTSKVDVEEEVAEEQKDCDPSPQDNIVTISEVYEQLQADARQAQALATRAGSKLDTCSYEQEYHTQPVYKCITCHGDKDVGVCLGCSMTCHVDHEVLELFEKRHFRCDCGNSVAGGSCQLSTIKDASNSENSYGQNFQGKYCLCHKGYDPSTDVMYQCALCEDWFHSSCVDAEPSNDDEDFFCRICVLKPSYQLLQPYLDLASAQSHSSLEVTEKVSPAQKASETPVSQETEHASEQLVDAGVASSTLLNSNAGLIQGTHLSIETDSSANSTATRKRKADDSSELESAAEVINSAAAATVFAGTSAGIESAIVGSSVSQRFEPPSAELLPNQACKKVKASDTYHLTSAIPRTQDRFAPNNWRDQYCDCDSCLKEYALVGLSWLIDDRTVSSATTIENNVLAAMTDADSSAHISPAFDAEAMTTTLVARLPRAQALDILTPLQLFQSSLKSQLNEFALRCPGVVVTKEVMNAIVEQAKIDSKQLLEQSKRARFEEALPE